jgi:hypothetical protein
MIQCFWYAGKLFLEASLAIVAILFVGAMAFAVVWFTWIGYSELVEAWRRYRENRFDPPWPIPIVPRTKKP